MPVRHLLKPLLAMTLAAAPVVCASVAQAADFPTRSVRLIVGFAPGGSNDIIARLLAPKLEEALKQPVVVENKPGASGNIAADAAIKAAPDGHTIFMCTTGTMAIQQFLPQPMPFDVEKITPITQIANTPYLMLVHKDVPATTVAEFVKYARENPGKVNFASSGNGTMGHLAGEMLRARANIDIVHVPYKGTGQAMIDMNSGRVSLIFDQPVSSMSHVKSGSLRALALANTKRLEGLPDMQTTEEAGLKDFNPIPWTGLCGAPGIPAENVKTLQQATAKALADPEIRARLVRDGLEPVGSTPEEFAAFLKAERAKWGGLLKNSDIKF